MPLRIPHFVARISSFDFGLCSTLSKLLLNVEISDYKQFSLTIASSNYPNPIPFLDLTKLTACGVRKVAPNEGLLDLFRYPIDQELSHRGPDEFEDKVAR